MPVDQTGENILFIMDGTSVEAHIQVQYVGEAARFSWVIPLTAIPEFSVGSQLLFTELLRFSVPTYSNTVTRDTCANNNGPFFPGARGTSDLASEGSSASSSSSGGASNGVQVVSRQAVGAFEVTVLSGGTASEIMDWLDQNGYAQLPGTLPIITQYIDENHLFAAVKLTRSAGVEEIHPLVLKYPGNVPCVPLRLTAVAATLDMGVRTFFLGEHRVVPQRYKHMEVNPLRIDWLNNANNYKDVISHSADDDAAGGQAFITEFAGLTNASQGGFGQGVNTQAFYSPQWNSSIFNVIEVQQVTSELFSQNLMFCSGPSCTYFHPLLKPLLDEFLPIPAGMTEGEFYGCLSCAPSRIDAAAWNGPNFAQAMQSRIVGPGNHAADLVNNNPYLTRMFTLISPEEMTVDPEFHERADLPVVPAARTSTQHFTCDGNSTVTLPDGREIWMGTLTTWPSWSPNMPWVQLVEDIPTMGNPVVLKDNTSVIDSELKTFNKGQRSPFGCVCAGGEGTSPWLAGLLLLGLVTAGRRRGYPRAPC
jgi:MYXO-CTERM domain-containing protein